MDGSIEITISDGTSTKMSKYDGANGVCSPIFPTSLLFPQADRGHDSFINLL